MSKIAVISDIHSNIDALNLVLRDIEKRNVDKIICLGDLITKYFYPAEVVDSIKSISEIVIKGNCDDLVVKYPSYKFARSKLGLDRLEYLENLPTKDQIEINKEVVNLYHSNPNDLESMFNPMFEHNSETEYSKKIISNYSEMFESNNVSIVGHTHDAYIGIEKKQKLYMVQNLRNLETLNIPIIINKDNRAIINVGSVGESNMMVKKEGKYVSSIQDYITYVILDDEGLKSGFTAEIIKIPYKEELKKIFFSTVEKQMNNEFPYLSVQMRKIKDALEKYDEESYDKAEKLIKKIERRKKNE